MKDMKLNIAESSMYLFYHIANQTCDSGLAITISSGSPAG